MDAPNAGNQRYIVTAGAVDSQRIADILRENVPGADERVPKGTPGKSSLPGDAWKADNSRVSYLDLLLAI